MNPKDTSAPALKPKRPFSRLHFGGVGRSKKDDRRPLQRKTSVGRRESQAPAVARRSSRRTSTVATKRTSTSAAAAKRTSVALERRASKRLSGTVRTAPGFQVLLPSVPQQPSHSPSSISPPPHMDSAATPKRVPSSSSAQPAPTASTGSRGFLRRLTLRFISKKQPVVVDKTSSAPPLPSLPLPSASTLPTLSAALKPADSSSSGPAASTSLAFGLAPTERGPGKSRSRSPARDTPSLGRVSSTLAASSDQLETTSSNDGREKQKQGAPPESVPGKGFSGGDERPFVYPALPPSRVPSTRSLSTSSANEVAAVTTEEEKNTPTPSSSAGGIAAETMALALFEPSPVPECFSDSDDSSNNHAISPLTPSVVGFASESSPVERRGRSGSTRASRRDEDERLFPMGVTASDESAPVILVTDHQSTTQGKTPTSSSDISPKPLKRDQKALTITVPPLLNKAAPVLIIPATASPTALTSDLAAGEPSLSVVEEGQEEEEGGGKRTTKVASQEQLKPGGNARARTISAKSSSGSLVGVKKRASTLALLTRAPSKLFGRKDTSPARPVTVYAEPEGTAKTTPASLAARKTSILLRNNINTTPVPVRAQTVRAVMTNRDIGNQMEGIMKGRASLELDGSAGQTSAVVPGVVTTMDEETERLTEFAYF